MDLKNSSEMAKKIIPGVLIAGVFFAGGVLAGSRISSSAGNSSLEKINTVYSVLKDRWYFGKDKENLEEELVENALDGMTSLEEDPHTVYFDLESAQAFTQSLSGSNVGIGFQFFMNRNNVPEVIQVFIDSPADQAGMQPGDAIVKIDDFETNTKTSDEIVSYIKGKDGQEVSLDVLRNGEILSFKVVPGSYDLTVSAATDGTTGELVLSNFAQSSGRDVAKALKRIKDSGANTLILDLRDNTGGYVTAAVDVASSFLPKDSVVFQEKLADGTVKEFKTNKQYSQVTFDQIVILQNERTASASEIIIGALKDNLPEGMVTTIGNTSYGKGTEQTAMPFEDGTSLKYTIAEWVTPKGTSINGVGFTPDVKIEENPVRTAIYYNFPEEEVIEADSVHPNAAALQQFLQYLGYNADRTDSYFSPASSEALKKFQEEHGLEATGNADKNAFDALVKEVGLKLNEERTAVDDQYQAAKNYLNQK